MYGDAISQIFVVKKAIAKIKLENEVKCDL